MSSVMGGINRTNSLTYLISVREDRRNAQVGAALNNRMGQVAASTNRVKNNARGAALATRNLGYVAQNASYQIADFFVMLQGGVGVGRALSTQLPQLLAGFGKMGAVLGAAAAIGATLVVMLQNQNKTQKDLTEVTEAYEKALSKSNQALIDFVKTGEAGTRTMKELTEATRRQAELDLSEVLAPPQASAWDGYLRGTLRALQIVGKAIASIPGISFIVEGVQADLARLNAYYTDYADITQSYDNAIYSFINTLAEAQIGTERFARAFGLLNSEISDQYGKLAAPLTTEGFPLFDDAKAAFDLVITALTELEGTADKNKWSDISQRQAARFKLKMNEAEDAVSSFKQEYARLTELQGNGMFQALFRETDLQAGIRSWDNALASGLVTLEKANAAKDALVKIDVWEDLQDIVIDVGKTFESQIIDAMKSGKFAVADFVNYALEQFARLALNRVFEPFFILLANSIPALGGGASGTPSPNVGRNPLARGMEFEPPPSAAPMYNYGQSISRVPGASRNLNTAAADNNVTVNVNNYGNDEVEVSQRDDGNGIEIDVLIKNTVRNGFNGGDFDSSLASTFGLRRLGY